MKNIFPGFNSWYFPSSTTALNIWKLVARLIRQNRNKTALAAFHLLRWFFLYPCHSSLLDLDFKSFLEMHYSQIWNIWLLQKASSISFAQLFRRLGPAVSSSMSTAESFPGYNKPQSILIISIAGVNDQKFQHGPCLSQAPTEPRKHIPRQGSLANSIVRNHMKTDGDEVGDGKSWPACSGCRTGCGFSDSSLAW